MAWQDIVVAMANVLFGYSLFYQVYVGFKEKKGFLSIQTSALTTIGLFMVAIVYFNFNLILSTIIALINGILWMTLLIQRIGYGKP